MTPAERVHALEIIAEQLDERVHRLSDEVAALEKRAADVDQNIKVLYERTSRKVPVFERAEKFVTSNQMLLIALMVCLALMGGVPGIQAVVAAVLKP